MPVPKLGVNRQQRPESVTVLYCILWFMRVAFIFWCTQLSQISYETFGIQVLRGSNFLSSLNEELKGSEDHSVLYSVVEQAGMGHLLVGKPFVREGPAWLLAPTNAAFQNFFQDMGLDMQVSIHLYTFHC